MKKIRVVQMGLGAMGAGMARLILSKKSLELVGACDADPGKIGKDLSEILDISSKTGITVGSDYIAEIRNTKPDIIVVAISSFVTEVYEVIMSCVKEGVNVITIAEEMAYPWAANKELSDNMDKAAREHGVSILGTGINPGFVLDALVIMMSGVSRSINRIEASRINDLSPFGPTVMKTQGVATSPEEFKKGIEDGSIVGHIGFQQSISMIALAMGIELDSIEEIREPIISKTERITKYVHVKPGMVAGCKHIGYGIKNGEKVITLIHPQQVKPELEDIDTGDYINIYGDPDIHLSIKPECPGGIGTIACTVNCLPLLLKAKPGMITMMDIPLPRICN